jgi:hypothetical protein
MKWFTILPLAATLSAAVAGDDPASGGQVTLPYAEFQKLIEAARPADSPPPPVPSAVLSALVSLALHTESATGTAEFQVMSAERSPVLVPLVADSATLLATEPSDAVVVRSGGFFRLLMRAAGTQTVRLNLAWPGNRKSGQIVMEGQIAPATVSKLVKTSPSGTPVAEISAGLAGPGEGEFYLPADGKFRIALGSPAEVPGERIEVPPVVASAEARMRVVSDGSFLCSTTWELRHQASIVWKVNPGAGAALVSAKVGGRAFLPVQSSDGGWEFVLPETNGASRVEFTYTGQGRAFGAVRGDFEAALPSTPLLVERTEWTLLLPGTFVPVAVEGNCEFASANSPQEIRLTKELSRGAAPSARVYYQKPETQK